MSTSQEFSINQLYDAIETLPEDEPKSRPGIWYFTQKEHWLGWVAGYRGPGAYSRKNWKNRDAKFVYNHIVCPDMLIYLIRAIPLPTETITAAEAAYETGSTLMAKAGAIRKVVPWSVIYEELVKIKKLTLLEKLGFQRKSN